MATLQERLTVRMPSGRRSDELTVESRFERYRDVRAFTEQLTEGGWPRRTWWFSPCRT